MFKKKINDFMELTRGYSVLMVLASSFIVFSYAYYSEKFSFFNFFIMVFALCALQMAANLFDDYIDIKKKLKNGTNLRDVHFDCFRSKARLIIDGVYSLKSVEKILITLFSIGLLAGVYFIFVSGWQIILYMLLGGVLTLFYPISSKYYCSDLIVGLIFGPLVITGGYFALTGEFNSNLLLLSFAIFFTTLVLLHTHNIMDWEFDIKNNKNTLAILSKTKDNAIQVLKWQIIISYFIVVYGVMTQRFNPYLLYVFLTLPIATKLLDSMKDYINIKDVKFEPRWYWGMFENWEQIKAEKIDFFMFRFYLARNFSFFFALFACIGAMK